MTRLETGTFYNCTNLESLHIPSTVTNIDESCVSGCGKLALICSDATGCAAESFANVKGLTFTVCAGHALTGDANGDGEVDLRDVTAMRRDLAGGWDVTVDPRAADVNGDGLFSLPDVTILCRRLAGWGV